MPRTANFALVTAILLSVATTAPCQTAETPYEHGTAKQDKNEWAASIADFDEAIRIKPDYAEAYQHRGDARTCCPGTPFYDLDGGIADYTTAIKLKPDLAEAYRGRGDAKRLPFFANPGEPGKWADAYLDGALADYTRAVKLKPDDVVARASLDWAEVLVHPRTNSQVVAGLQPRGSAKRRQAIAQAENEGAKTAAAAKAAALRTVPAGAK